MEIIKVRFSITEVFKKWQFYYELFVSAVCMFLAVAIFGGSHTRRDWLMYPNWNYLSWSYGLAILSFFIHGFAAIFLYLAARQSYELRRESRNLIMQMHPNPQHRLGW